MDYRPPRPEQPYAWDDERLSAYLDGELSAPEQAQLEARLVVDPELRQLVDELRAVRQQLEILPEYRLKPTFADQVLRRAEQEILLSPLGRETSQPVAAAATPHVPAFSAASPPSLTPSTATTSPATTLPARTTARLWRRGAIWTAVAAAAVLLLMVTNRPNTPQQDHLARSDRPEPALVKSAGKDLAAPTASPAGVDKTPQNINGAGAKEHEHLGLAKTSERESQQSPLEQAMPSTSTVVGEADAKNAGALPPAIPFGAAAPKPGPVGDMKPQANQMARGAGSNKQNSNQQSDVDRQSDKAKDQAAVLPGKSLLKSQSPGQLKGTQEKQSAAQRKQLSPELAALLASDEFSQLASAGKKDSDPTAEEEVLVVYMTPRDTLRAESSFESLLASNSIGLAEKPLHAVDGKQLQSSMTRAKSEARDAEPRAKAASKDEQDAGAKDAKAVKTSEAEQPESPSNAPALRKEASPAPASDPTAETPKAASVNELYYLEAEAGQVDELLRQLRSSPDQFSRLNISSRALKLAEHSPQLQDEKSTPKKPAATLPPATRAFGDDARVEGLPIAGTQPYGNQQPGELKQMAKGAVPVTPAAPVAASAPTAPAAAALPPGPALPTPGAQPFAAPASPAPKELSAVPAVIPENAPSGLDSASTLGDAKGGFGQTGHGIGNRRAMQADKSQKEAGDRAIAYRLRGVEALLPAMKAEEGGEAFAGGAGGGGGGAAAGMLGKAEFDMLKSDGAAKRGNAAKAAVPAKPSDARNQPKSENGAQKQDAKTEELKNGDPVPASPPTSDGVTIPAPVVLTQEKKMEQPRPKANPTGEPARMPAESETQQRKLGRNKEAAEVGESSLTESSTRAGAVASSAMRRNEFAPSEVAKKSSPAPATKKVRVLFVIEHEAPKE